MKNEISLPIVKNQNGDFVHIKNINSDNRNLEYFCPCCDSIVKPRSINEDNKMQPHFYHLDTTKCKQETVYHFVYKHWMFTRDKPFSVVIDDNEVEYVCEKVEIEQSHKTINGLYTPDLTLYTKCGKTIYVEVNYSNKKRADEYFAKWKELGNIVSEINVRQLFNNDYSEANLKIPAIFDGNDCLEDYKNSLSKDSYYNNIHKYKLTQEYSEERMQQLKKLDWFYRDVCKYIHNSISKEELLQTFGCVEYMDMEVCYDMIKNKACCKTLKNDFKEIINKSFESYITTLQIAISNNFLHSFNFKKSGNFITIAIYSKYNGNCDLIIGQNENFVSIRHYGLFKYSLFEKDINIKIKKLEQELIKAMDVINKYKNFKLNIIDRDTFLSDIRYSDIEILKQFDIIYNKKHVATSIKSLFTKSFKNIMTKTKNKLLDFILENYSKEILNFISLDIVSYNTDYAEINVVDNNSEIKCFGFKKYTLNDLNCSNCYVEICEILKEFIDRKIEDKNKILYKYENIKKNVVDIFIKNKEFITDYDINRSIYNISIPVIWFKTKDNIEYIYITNDLKIIFKNLVLFFNTIDISNVLNFKSDELYIRKDYHLTYNPNKQIVIYDFPDPFSYKKINISFSSKNNSNDFIYLKDFNIVGATREILNVLKNINIILANETKEINNSKLIMSSPKRVSSLEINNEIINILSPILNVVNENSRDSINISFNIKDTIVGNSGYQPWLIKDFIKALNLIDIYNFENIKTLNLGGQ